MVSGAKSINVAIAHSVLLSLVVPQDCGGIRPPCEAISTPVVEALAAWILQDLEGSGSRMAKDSVVVGCQCQVEGPTCRKECEELDSLRKLQLAQVMLSACSSAFKLQSRVVVCLRDLLVEHTINILPHLDYLTTGFQLRPPPLS
jgi:hypothetical protein